MKALYYILTALFGLFGVLGILRSVELLTAGAFKPAQILFAVGGLALAYYFFGKARAN